MGLLKVGPRAHAGFRRRFVRRASVAIDAVDVNKRWSDCKRAASLGNIRLCRGTRSSALKLRRRGQRRCYRLRGRLQPALFMTPFAIRYCLLFPPDRVEVPGNAGHVHREAQDFKKQVHRLHPNRRSGCCPQADSAAVITGRGGRHLSRFCYRRDLKQAALNQLFTAQGVDPLLRNCVHAVGCAGEGTCDGCGGVGVVA